MWHSNKRRFAQLHVPMEFQQPNSGSYPGDFDHAAKCEVEVEEEEEVMELLVKISNLI